MVFHTTMWKAAGFFYEGGGNIATKYQTKSLKERAYKEIQPLMQQTAIEMVNYLGFFPKLRTFHFSSSHDTIM